jgi:hypothetical protein
MSFDWGVLHTVGKIFLKAIKYFHHIIKKKTYLKKYEHPKFWDNKLILILGLPLGSFKEK